MTTSRLGALSVLIVCYLALLLPGTTAFAQQQGSLVIVGGGLDPGNHHVYRTFIQLARDSGKEKIAIIPAASGVPVQSGRSMQSALIRYGVNPENILLVPLAVMDDDSTQDTDESAWKPNAWDPELAAEVRSCSGIWFTGGDQSRILQTLLQDDGIPSPVLQAVWEVYSKGGVVGGTSAGAAVMSDQMIAGGTSLEALTAGVVRDLALKDSIEEAGVLIRRGLGFFPEGLVDQHFHQRSRIGRLAVALTDAGTESERGFGIDENTALVYHSRDRIIEVIGTGAVTVLHPDLAQMEKVPGYLSIENIRVDYLTQGDTLDLNSLVVKPASNKKSIEGGEASEDKDVNTGGALSNAPLTFPELLCEGLMDTRGRKSIGQFTPVDSSSGFILRLYRTGESRAWYGRTRNVKHGYCVTGALMDFLPARVSYQPVTKP
jgi:cyanophycinase